MNIKELVALGERIVSSNGIEDELNEMMEIFGRNVPHPDGVGLFYYPENYNARKDNIADYNPSVVEVVDITKVYKPIRL